MMFERNNVSDLNVNLYISDRKRVERAESRVEEGHVSATNG